MATDRIIYQSESLFVSDIKKSGGNITDADISEVNRVQDMSYNLEVSRTDINEFGQLAALSREVTEPPTVSLDFSYLLTDGTQEEKLGVTLNSADSLPKSSADSMTKNILGGSTEEKNYYILTVPEGEDVHGNTPLNASDHGVIGVGNGFVTSYGMTAAVGELATASVSVEASNIMFKNDISGTFTNPSIDTSSSTGERLSNTVDFASVVSSDGSIQNTTSGDEIYAIRPGDILIDFDAVGYLDGSKSAGDLNVGGARLPGAGGSLGAGNTAVHVQSVSLDVPIGRSPLNRLGSHFAFARKTDFPVNMTLSVSALMTDFTDGSLDGLMCEAEQKRDIAIVLNDRCGNATNMVFVMKNAILDTQAFSASIGDNKTVDLTFSSQVGGANDSENGIFLLAEPTNKIPEYGETPTPESF